MPAKTPKLTRAEADKILAQLRASDPLLAFKPSPVQELFLRSQSPFRYITGGNRTGKTASNAIDLAMTARGLHPYRPNPGHVRILCLSNSRQQAAQVFGRKLFEACEIPGPLHDLPLIPPDEVEVSWVKVGMKVPYSAKTKHADILFSWSGVDDLWERLQGLKLDHIYLDEDAGTLKLLDELFMRGLDVRGSPGAAPYAGSISWSSTPTCGTDALLKFKEWCQANNPSESYFMIPSGDNPAVSKAALNEAEKFLGAKQSEVRIHATKDASELMQVYGEQWNDARHMLQADYVPLPTDNLWLGYDPGMEHPTGMVIAAVSMDNPRQLKLVKAWNHSKQTVDYDVRCLDEWLLGRRLAGVVYDTAAKNQDKRGSSVLADLMAKMKEAGTSPLFGYFGAHKRREQGIPMMRHYLDPDPYDKTVAPLIVVNPSQASGGQLIRQQILRYRGKEATRFTGEGGVVKKDDEMPDCIRYLCMHRIGWNPGGACGRQSKFAPAPDQRPVGAPPPPPPTYATPYERHLALSRQRRPPRRDWTASDF